MKYIKAMAILLALLFLGEIITRLTGNIIPGSVYGMILLFIALLLGIIKSEDVRPVASVLTSNMMILFVPAAVGIVSMWHIIAPHWHYIVGICLVTTLFIIIAVGLVQQQLTRKSTSSHADASSSK